MSQNDRLHPGQASVAGMGGRAEPTGTATPVSWNGGLNGSWNVSKSRLRQRPTRPGASRQDNEPHAVPDVQAPGSPEVPTSNWLAVFLRAFVRALGAWTV
jgi:hypothetical protein